VSGRRPARRGLASALAGLLLAALAAAPTAAEERFITVASTTSTQNSGLFDHLLPLFEKTSGIRVRVVAVGTGQALRLARNGDADVLFVHHRPSEERFVAEGFGVARLDVMYNDFVVVGPAADPAAVGGLAAAPAALARIAAAGAAFLSRGDDSGTHKKEVALWRLAGVDPAAASGTWYRETGAGMGATLNTAVAMDAYALSDRGTWLAFRNRGGHEVLVEGDARLFNPYGVILVDAARHPHVKAADGKAFIAWLVSPAGQAAIASFRIGGAAAFMPNAKAGGR
jgi:tungstate transport system substrate-binding protein